MRAIFYSLATAACLALLVWAKPTVTTAKGAHGPAAGGALFSMAKQCRPGKTSAKAQGWRLKLDSVVRVYYRRGDFSASEAMALWRAIDNWNEALRDLVSGPFFLIGGESNGVVVEGTSITVTRGRPKGKERVGEIKLHSVSNGRVHLVVIVSPEITTADALTSLMTHELGHTLGLADCYECRTGTTAMAASRGHKGNDVYAPSECDMNVIAATYQARRNEQARSVSPKRKVSAEGRFD